MKQVLWFLVLSRLFACSSAPPMPEINVNSDHSKAIIGANEKIGQGLYTEAIELINNIPESELSYQIKKEDVGVNDGDKVCANKCRSIVRFGNVSKKKVIASIEEISEIEQAATESCEPPKYKSAPQYIVDCYQEAIKSRFKTVPKIQTPKNVTLGCTEDKCTWECPLYICPMFYADKTIQNNIQKARDLAGQQNQELAKAREKADSPECERANLSVTICLAYWSMKQSEREIQNYKEIQKMTGAIDNDRLVRAGQQQINSRTLLRIEKEKYLQLTKKHFSTSACVGTHIEENHPLRQEQDQTCGKNPPERNYLYD